MPNDAHPPGQARPQPICGHGARGQADRGHGRGGRQGQRRLLRLRGLKGCICWGSSRWHGTSSSGTRTSTNRVALDGTVRCARDHALPYTYSTLLYLYLDLLTDLLYY